MWDWRAAAVPNGMLLNDGVTHMRWTGCLGLVAFWSCATLVGGGAHQAGPGQFALGCGLATSYQVSGRVTRVFGPALGFGASPERSAAGFVREHARAFGVGSDELVAGNHFNDRLTQPVMFDPETGECKFTLVYYAQYKDGLPVYQSDLRLLVRNVQNFPLVLAASSLRELGDFSIPRGAAVVDPGECGRAAALAAVPDLVNFGTSEYVIWAGSDDEWVEPALAVTFVADNGWECTGGSAKWRFVVDAATGEILHRENLIRFVDVVGNVSANATPGIPPKADWCNPLDVLAMPEARVSIGDTFVYADPSGDFTIPNEGSDPVMVVSAVRGPWFRVYNQAGPDSVVTLPVTPPGPANLTHNSPDSQFTRAEVNAYIQANAVRYFVLLWNDLYPTIHDQPEFPVNVNLEGYCGGYYDGDSINFFQAGYGCANAAFSGIVHHEYGHHVIACGGSGQGAYGEGMANSIAVLLADEPGIGYGLFTSLGCDVPPCTAENDAQYPCGNGGDDCGAVLAGAIWSTRNELAVTNPDSYTQIIATLTINSILLHSGDMVTPAITIDFLTLDDDDGDIGNGTPHYAEICAGFGAHGLDCPPLSVGLRVTPAEGFDSAGPVGGPFTPESKDYTVENLGDYPINYSVTATEPWLTIMNGAGTLPAYGDGIVTALINASADSLAAGAYADTISFVNTTDHVGDTTRPVTLEIVLIGDLDGDGDVDLADLAILLSHYGTTGGASYEDGDLDGDGDIDLTDLAMLLAVYGTTCP